MTKWINRTVVNVPRNGTTTNTVNHTAAAAGSLLLLVIDAPAQITTPSGYTQRASALNNTHFALYTKTATAGESSFTLTLSAANYPAGVIVYEFALGTTFGQSNSAVGQQVNDSANPSISVTGTNLLMAGFAAAQPSGSQTQTTTWSGSTTDVDTGAGFSTTDGYQISIGYVEDSTATTYAPTPHGNNVGTGALSASERLTWSLQPAAAVTQGSSTAVRAIAVGLVNPPAVSGSMQVIGGGPVVAVARVLTPTVAGVVNGGGSNPSGPSSSWQTVRVFGTWRNPATGLPATGKVRFTFPVRVVSLTDSIIFPAGTAIEVTLTNLGQISVYLPAVDDPDNTPTTWSIEVTEMLDPTSGTNSRYTIRPSLAQAATGLDLATVQ